jgi:hypothetical protein
MTNLSPKCNQQQPSFYLLHLSSLLLPVQNAALFPYSDHTLRKWKSVQCNLYFFMAVAKQKRRSIHCCG